MMQVVMVGIGGFIGAALRFIIGNAVHRFFPIALFPAGTFVVNITGCFLIGILLKFDELRNVFSPDLRLFVFVGIFGALTTFSTFGKDTVNLFKSEKITLALVNIGIHIFLGLTAVWIGYFLGSKIGK